MTAKQLIAKLKKMPPDARVFLADHDHSLGEVNGPATQVFLLEREDAASTSEWHSNAPNVVVIGI